MRILLINPPHPSIGSRIPDEHLPPLGLLCVGGPLLDAGHEVKLLDADRCNLPLDRIIQETMQYDPQAILLGHSGSTSAHPTVIRIVHGIREAMPSARIIYGGIFPTYHWKDILTAEPLIDFIIRGEGEETVVRLMEAMESNVSIDHIPGLAFNRNSQPFATLPAPMIRDLDAHRIGWELIDFRDYSYWGNRRVVVVQFSRGCPHLCNYCGQRGFWTRWRHRDPRYFAAEIAWLHHKHGVEVFNLADENPTASRSAWRQFLEALIAERVNVTLVGSTRADDIVRDADLLHLYKQAGVTRFLLGIESYDESTLRKMRKNGTPAKDRQAIQLLRKHGIISMATYAVGFEEETDRDYFRSLRQLISYDPDQIQLLYMTPHRWTPFYRMAEHRRVIQTDLSCWDYKHQVLATRYMKPWRVLLWVKFIEAIMQLRPRSLMRLLIHPEPAFRAAMRWYYRIGRRVWPYEISRFFFSDMSTNTGPSLRNFWGPCQEDEQDAMTTKSIQCRINRKITTNVKPELHELLSA